MKVQGSGVKVRFQTPFGSYKNQCFGRGAWIAKVDFCDEQCIIKACKWSHGAAPPEIVNMLGILATKSPGRVGFVIRLLSTDPCFFENLSCRCPPWPISCNLDHNT